MQQDIETAIGAGIYDQGYKADNGSGNNSRCYIFYTESGFFSGGEDRVSPTVQISEIVLKSQERTERTTGKKVKEKIIYSLALDEELVL